MQKNKKALPGRQIVGTVIVDAMDKTIVVKAGRTMLHKLFRKRIRKFSKFRAHDEKNSAKKGDRVKIAESRPFSKSKRWKLIEIVEKAG